MFLGLSGGLKTSLSYTNTYELVFIAGEKVGVMEKMLHAMFAIGILYSTAPSSQHGRYTNGFFNSFSSGQFHFYIFSVSRVRRKLMGNCVYTLKIVGILDFLKKKKKDILWQDFALHSFRVTIIWKIIPDIVQDTIIINNNSHRQ